MPEEARLDDSLDFYLLAGLLLFGGMLCLGAATTIFCVFVRSAPEKPVQQFP